MSNSRKHFHTFDALRFFSFLIVFLHHIPDSNRPFLTLFTKSGGIGVSFFFVLSGFLITYILLYEKIHNGEISLKKFFMRRILRIWPLFYAMILFAFLTPFILNFLHLSYSNEGYKPNWLLSSLFLENYKMMITGSFPDTSPLRVMWSLCIEEHFYIVWGVIFYFISLKRVPHLIAISIIVGSIFRIAYYHFGIASLDLFSNIDYFAFGAIPAYMLLFKDSYMQKVGNIPLTFKYALVFVATVLVFVLPNFHLGWLEIVTPILFSILFATIILFTLPASNYIIISDRYLISKLGVFTYGLYLFHTIIISLAIQINKMLLFKVNSLLLALAALILTITVSILSYHLFEKQFLKLKRFFY